MSTREEDEEREEKKKREIIRAFYLLSAKGTKGVARISLRLSEAVKCQPCDLYQKNAKAPAERGLQAFSEEC